MILAGTDMPANPGPEYLAAEAEYRSAQTLTEKIAAMALERGLRVNSPLDPERRTGWIGIDFEGSENACRSLIERRVFVDYRPGCGIRVGPHFYTTDP